MKRQFGKVLNKFQLYSGLTGDLGRLKTTNNERRKYSMKANKG